MDRYSFDRESATILSEGLLYFTGVGLFMVGVTIYKRNQLKTFMLTKHNVLSEEDFETVVHRRAIELAEVRARRGQVVPAAGRNPLNEVQSQAANNNSSSNPAAPKEPEVEYLEDSKLSVDYFRMKGSVFFSAVAKDDAPGKILIEKSQMMKIGYEF